MDSETLYQLVVQSDTPAANPGQLRHHLAALQFEEVVPELLNLQISSGKVRGAAP